MRRKLLVIPMSDEVLDAIEMGQPPRPILLLVLALISSVSIGSFWMTWLEADAAFEGASLLESLSFKMDLEEVNVTVSFLYMDIVYDTQVHLKSADCDEVENAFARCEKRLLSSELARGMLVATTIASSFILLLIWPSPNRPPMKLKWVRFLPSLLLILTPIVWGVALTSGEQSSIEEEMIEVLPQSELFEPSDFNFEMRPIAPVLQIGLGIVSIPLLIFLDPIDKRRD